MPKAAVPTRRWKLDWSLGWTRRPGSAPKTWVPATVPGAVQLDWARAEGWPPYWVGENFRAYGWMEDVWWVYRARLEKPSLAAGERLVLVCGGVDYACEVRVAGKVVHAQEGMFTPFEVDLTRVRDGAWVEVVVSPAPKVPVVAGVPDAGRKEASASTKPAVAYTWDFHPRLIPLGIWDETYLELRSGAEWLDHVEVAVTLDGRGAAQFRLVAEGAAKRVRWTVTAPNGRPVAEVTGEPAALAVEVKKPRLWWPAGEGEPAQYTSVVEVLGRGGKVRQRVEQKVGVRRVRLVMHEGQWRRENRCPATQETVPITFEVNGRPIFVRGANWVPPEIFPGVVTAERTDELLALVQGANLNLIRCWGGGHVQKDAFFDACDARGILVWQEFPLACNRYEGSPEYLAVLDRESRSIVRRLRRHASLALWCGGNELFNGWSGMTMQDGALRLLAANCWELDPGTPFLPTSPVYGIFHGDYRFRAGRGPDARTVHEIYPAVGATAYMEFGVPGPAPVETLREVIPAAELWPPRPEGSWKAHHAFGAWHDGEPNSWLYPEVADHYFGPSANLEDLVARLQLLQAEGYKSVYEEARRQKPSCSAAACWVFNEPWPCAANNSIVAWPAVPKPAYHAVAAANRPTMLSARVRRFDWSPGELFAAELFLLNDAPEAVGSLEVTAWLVVGDARVEVGRWSCPGAEPGRHCAGPAPSAPVPAAAAPTFELVVEAEGRPELTSRYTFAYRR